MARRRSKLVAALALGASVALGAFGATGCSHAQKRSTPELAHYAGRKVALVGVDGEPTARKIVEVALVNQLLARGTFILVSKQDVEAARAAPEQDPMDWKGIARRAGADVALRAKILDFTADEHEGYDTEQVEDSQLAEEEGKSSATAEQVYKVKSMHGLVRVDLEFTELGGSGKTFDTRDAIAEADDTVKADTRKGAIHLPPKLAFLEKIANQAFRKFFDKYN